MAETHRELLDQLERESRTKQEEFMNFLADKLKRPRVSEPPKHPFRGAPDFWNTFEWPVEERIEKFIENFKAVGGHAERVNGMEDVTAFIAGKAQEMSARYVLRQDQQELADLGLESAIPAARVSVWNQDPSEDWKARAAESDFGVVLADYAAAYTGSVTVLSDKTKGRSVSLLPTVLFVILPVERLKTRLGEILPDFDRMGRENLPAGIHFISGPSRSADIENDLTIGVHGPGIVYALVVG
jgi:L-lactate dehydrogenase complex protein LldG